jgi:hypothetical protein
MNVDSSLKNEYRFALIQNGGVIRDCEAMATPAEVLISLQKAVIRKQGGRCLPERGSSSHRL